MHTSSICDTKPAISLKRSSLEPNLVKGVYRNSCTAYQLVTSLATGGNIFLNGYLAQFLSERDEIWQCYGSGQSKLIPKFRKLWSGGPVTPCSNMHQFFTDALVKWFSDNFRMFADSFSVLSISTALSKDYVQAFCTSAPHCAVVTASRGGSLRQHGLLVLCGYDR